MVGQGKIKYFLELELVVKKSCLKIQLIVESNDFEQLLEINVRIVIKLQIVEFFIIMFIYWKDENGNLK